MVGAGGAGGASGASEDTNEELSWKAAGASSEVVATAGGGVTRAAMAPMVVVSVTVTVIYSVS